MIERRRLLSIFSVVVMISLLFIATQVYPIVVETFLPSISTRPLNSDQLKDFLQSNNINPIIAEDVGNVTAVLYTNMQEMGLYLLYDSRPGIFYSNGIGKYWYPSTIVSPDNNTDRTQVSAVIGSIDDLNVVGIVINDSVLYKNTATVTVTFVDGKDVVVPISNRLGLIVAKRTGVSSNYYRSIVFRNSNGETIYTKNP